MSIIEVTPPPYSVYFLCVAAATEWKVSGNTTLAVFLSYLDKTLYVEGVWHCLTPAVLVARHRLVEQQSAWRELDDRAFARR